MTCLLVCLIVSFEMQTFWILMKSSMSLCSFPMKLWPCVAQSFYSSWRSFEVPDMGCVNFMVFSHASGLFWIKGLQCRCSSLNLLCFGKFITDTFTFFQSELTSAADPVVILSRHWCFFGEVWKINIWMWKVFSFHNGPI